MIEMWQTLKEMLIDIGYGIVDELDNMILLLKIMIPVILALLCMPFLETVLLSTIFVFLFSYAERLRQNMNNEIIDGMPVMQERLTSLEDDIIVVDNEEKALEYLCELEDYLERKGLFE